MDRGNGMIAAYPLNILDEEKQKKIKLISLNKLIRQRRKVLLSSNSLKMTP